MLNNIVFFHSDESIYNSEEAPFINTGNHPTIKKIENKFPIIKKEVEDYINGKFKLTASNPNAPKKDNPQSWNNVYFTNYMLSYRIGKKYFPETYEILTQNKDLTLAGITTLKAGGRLMPHCGETNAIIRCHIGLKVPGKLPDLGLKVKSESRSWEEGKAFAFNDAFVHEAWNNTSEDRFVLVFDIIKPEYSKYKKLICAYCLGIASARIFYAKIGAYNHTPLLIRKLTAIFFAFFWRIYLLFK